MTRDDCNAMLDLIADYFPRLGDRINKSPALVSHTLATLAPLERRLVEQALLRYVTSHNMDPTWDALMDTVEKIQGEWNRADAWERTSDYDTKKGWARHKGFSPADAMATAYEAAASQMRTEADKAWAKMHVAFVVQGIAGPDGAEKKIARYEQLAQQYPELKDACQKQVGRLMHVAEGI